MSTVLDSQLVEPQEFTPLDNYQFSGNDVTVGKKRLLIENLRRKAVIYLAAQAVGINKLTVYRWRDSDSQFALAMSEAMEDAKEIMENSVYEDALNGNTLLKMFWLKRHDPAYRDKMTIDVTAVNEEIQERIRQLEGKGVEPLNRLQIASPLDNLQKDASSSSSPAPLTNTNND